LLAQVHASQNSSGGPGEVRSQADPDVAITALEQLAYLTPARGDSLALDLGAVLSNERVNRSLTSWCPTRRQRGSDDQKS
jgi:hypothetical protein